MPSHRKELVRARMEKTGETYQQALRHVRAQETRTPVPSPDAKTERSQTVADTAFSIAVVRAEEAKLPENERLFSDPYASMFLQAGAHAAESTQRVLDMPFFRDGIRLRTRYIDDCVRDGLASGLEQIVILGAGFDARGLRMKEIEARGARVFEVDTPYQLERKRRLLAEAGVKLPARIAYVPFELDVRGFAEYLEGALEMAGFRPNAGAMFVWEGVIGYIDDEAIDESLRFMLHAGGAKSRVAFTFADEKATGDETMVTRIERCGFTSFEEHAGDALWRQYLPGTPHPNAWVTKLGLATV